MKSFLLTMPVFFLFFGCATLPKECVNMSIRLENQIETLEKNHLELLELYYQEKEKEMLALLADHWLEEYIDTLFQHPEIVEVWNEVLVNNNEKERMETIKEIVLMVQNEFGERKKSYILPITEERDKMRMLLLDEYRKMKEMNTAITRNLGSIREIQEIRDQYLSKILDMGKVEQEFHRSVQYIDSALRYFQYYQNEVKK